MGLAVFSPTRAAGGRAVLLVFVLLLSSILAASGLRSSVTATPQAVAASLLAARLDGIREVNYYPAQENWSNMWTYWDPHTIDADFGRIAALHANTVRIILQAATIGYPVPQPVMLQHLKEIVGLAQAHGLSVHLTLFDHWSNYSDVAGSERWARAVLAPYAGDSRIAFVELQNEIDPSNATAMAWVRQLLPFIRALSGGIPVTISLSGQEGIADLRSLLTAIQPARLDFADFHYYGTPELAYANLKQVQQAVAPLPLFIGETGFSTAPASATAVAGLGSSAQSLEAYQDYYYRMVQKAASALGLPPVSVWTFTDFTPRTIVGASLTSRQYNFGLFRANGVPKPIVASVTQEFAQGSVDSSFNQGFEQCAYGVPDIWQRFGLGTAFFACDTGVAHGGAASGRISHSLGYPGAAPAFVVSPPVSGLSAGGAYTATVWARGANLTGTTRIVLEWFDANAHDLGTAQSLALPPGTTGWTLLTARSVAPAGAAYVQIRLESAANRGAAWFDDVGFQAPADQFTPRAQQRHAGGGW